MRATANKQERVNTISEYHTKPGAKDQDFLHIRDMLQRKSAMYQSFMTCSLIFCVTNG